MQSCCTGRTCRCCCICSRWNRIRGGLGTPMQPAGVLYVPGRCDMVKLKPG